MPSFFERVTSEALAVRPVKLLLTALAIPFYVLGLLLGLVVVACLFAVGAVKVGVAEVRAKASPNHEVT